MQEVNYHMGSSTIYYSYIEGIPEMLSNVLAWITFLIFMQITRDHLCLLDEAFSYKSMMNFTLEYKVRCAA